MGIKEWVQKPWHWFTSRGQEPQPRSLEPEQRSDTVAISRETSSDELVVFIHGLSGSPQTTWQKVLSLLAQDPELAAFGYDCYAFPTTLWRAPLGTRMPGIQDLAEGLRTHIQAHHSSAKKIFLVAHSLGGLVARQLILDTVKRRSPLPYAGLMLIATPNEGAALAAWAKTLSSDHKHLRQLAEGSDLVDGINKDWILMNVEQFVRTVYVVAGTDAIVKATSAAPYIGHNNVETLIGYGHTDVLEPVDRLDTRYKVIRNFLLGTDKAPSRTSHIPLVEEIADPLFDQYSLDVERFYQPRPHDEALAACGNGRAAWVAGPPGVGKSVGLMRKAVKGNWTIHSVLLDSLAGLSAHALLCEVCSSVVQRAGETVHIAHDTPSRELIKHLQRSLPKIASRVAVVVEEIPLAEGEELRGFARELSQFIVETRGGVNFQCIWLLSSRANPQQSLGIAEIKILDVLEVIVAREWPTESLLQLILAVNDELRLQLTVDEMKQLASAAAGSPRLIKVALRQKRSHPEKAVTDLMAALRSEWGQP